MILYDSSDRTLADGAAAYFKFMDRRYASVGNLFAHHRQYEILEHIIRNRLDLSSPIRVFDLGCGQGQLLEKTHEIVSVTAPSIIDDSLFLGLDASPVAIAQCEKRYPKLTWIVDTFQNFITRPDTVRSFIGTFDLIINRGGLVVVDAIKDLAPLISAIQSLTKRGGLYFSSEGVSHYQVWINRVNRNVWTEKQDRTGNEHTYPDPFDLALSTFGEVERIPDASFYLNIYCKAVEKSAITSLPDKPVCIDFDLIGRQTERVYISGDELTYERLASSLPTETRNAFPIPFQYNAATATAHTKLVDLARRTFQSSRPKLVTPAMRIRSLDGTAIDLSESAIAAVADTHDPIYYPRFMMTCRDYIRRVSELLSVAPDILLIGAGLDDHAVQSETGAPRVDLFEFAVMFDWLLRRLTVEEGKRALWLSTRTTGAHHKQEGWEYQNALTLKFARTEQEICRKYEAVFLDLAPVCSETSIDQEHIKTVVRAALRAEWNQRASVPLPHTDVADPRYPTPASARVVYRNGTEHTLGAVRAQSVYLSFAHDMEDKEFDGIDGGQEFARITQRLIMDWLFANRRAGLKELMLIGDSVRMRRDDATGYVLPAYERLVGSFNITHLAHNTQGTRAILKWLPEWLGRCEPEVVHINAGLHDLMYDPNTDTGPEHTKPDDYGRNVREIITLLKSASVDRIVWATCTPVFEPWHNAWHTDGKPRQNALRFLKKQEDIRLYNRIALDIVQDEQIEVNDLFAIIEKAGISNCLRMDGVHLNAFGSELLGAAVASYLTGETSSRRAGPVWSDWQEITSHTAAPAPHGRRN